MVEAWAPMETYYSESPIASFSFYKDAQICARATLGVSDTASELDIQHAYEQIKKPTIADDAAQRLLLAAFNQKAETGCVVRSEEAHEKKAEKQGVKRPPGRAPKGKRWDSGAGEWVDDDVTTGPDGIRKDDVSSPLGSNPVVTDSIDSEGARWQKRRVLPP